VSFTQLTSNFYFLKRHIYKKYHPFLLLAPSEPCRCLDSDIAVLTTVPLCHIRGDVSQFRPKCSINVVKMFERTCILSSVSLATNGDALLYVQ
jgi:hypothetical protein